MGGALCRPELVQLLMPPLIGKWNALSDDDRALFPLLECLTSVAQALGSGFHEFAQPVFARCLRLIERNLTAEAPGERPINEGHGPDSDFIVCALDLISGLAEGLGPSAEALVAGSALTQLLFACMRSPMADIRQSAYALVGDLSKSCVGVLRPGFPEVIPLLASQLNPEFVSVCNNATWAVGEIAVKVRAARERGGRRARAARRPPVAERRAAAARPAQGSRLAAWQPSRRSHSPLRPPDRPSRLVPPVRRLAPSCVRTCPTSWPRSCPS